MKKVTNSSQRYNLYIYGLGMLVIAEYIITVFLISELIRQESIFIMIILGVLFYLITRAIINCLLYFISKEECFIEEEIFIYKRILFKIIVLKVIKISILEIKDIIDKGSSQFNTSNNYWNFLHYIMIFYNPYQRIIIEKETGEKYCIFTDLNPYPSIFLYDDTKFLKNFNFLKKLIDKSQEKITFNFKLDRIKKEYSINLEKRYIFILEKIIEEKIFFITKMEEKIIINGYREAIENLEIFKNMEWEEINFYNFYVDYLSKKENKDKIVLVGYNGIDGKEVTMSRLKDDINEIRDSKSTFKD